MRYTNKERRAVSGERKQVAGCRLQVAGCRLQVAGCRKRRIARGLPHLGAGGQGRKTEGRRQKAVGSWQKDRMK
jgi:hypothetical protein